jgi:hypothetical protein
MSLRVTRLLIRRALYIVEYGNISKTGPTIAVGSTKAQGSKEKLTSRVRAIESN